MDPNSSVDGLSEPAVVAGPAPAVAPPAAVPTGDAKVLLQWKLIIGVLLGIPYVLYIVWCLFLLAVLPDADASPSFVTIGLASCGIGSLILLAVSAFAFMRISASHAMPNAKMIALIKLVAYALPGLILSGATAFMISQEPSLSIVITNPISTEAFVAPLSISFSAEKAVGSLAKRGFKPVEYSWDINGDGQPDQKTLTPELTASFDQQGIFTVRVGIKGTDGTVKVATKKFLISKAVFSVTPLPPIIDRPTVFNLEQLYPRAEDVVAVSWDFDGDGKFDEENVGMVTSYTYLKTGSFNVSAVVSLANKTQVRYDRSIVVQEPLPLPFPVAVTSQPKNLIGTPPFAALFTVETPEPIYSVQWDFGDGQKAEGIRSTHTFTRRGTFPVVARVRSQSGVIAEVNTVVKIVEELSLSDLRFEGTPAVDRNKITGEVPLTLNLTPITQQPFIQFSWEAEDATEVGSTNENLQAIYRRPGTYTIVMIAQDLESHALRFPITVEVLPPSSVISFQMKPETGVAPLTVLFDGSESSIPDETISGFIWDFGDGSAVEYGGAVTQHVFTKAGTYRVSLSAKTSSGRQENTSRTVVVRAPSLQARILASRLSGPAPLTVAFDASPSSGVIQTYTWDFGDGVQNEGMNVQHTFLEAGVKTVTLTVKDVSGASHAATVVISIQ